MLWMKYLDINYADYYADETSEYLSSIVYTDRVPKYWTNLSPTK